MKIFTYIAHGMIIIATVLLLAAILFFKTKSPREQARFFYKIHKQFPSGSYEEQWILDKAITLDSTFALAYRTKSSQYIRAGLFQKGFEYLNAAVDLDPIDHLGYRGYLKLFTMRDYEGAIADLMYLDTLTPNFRDAPWGKDIYYLLGMAHHGLENYEQAYQYLDLSVSETKKERSEEWVTVEIFFYRAIMQWKLNRMEDAIIDFDKAIHYYDKFSEAHFYKSVVLKEMGKLEEAIESLGLARKYFDMGYVEINPYYNWPYQIDADDLDSMEEELVLVSAIVH